MPIEQYNAFVSTWNAKERRAKYRNASIVAAIFNKPVYGYDQSEPVTPEELLGETAPESALPSLEAHLLSQSERKLKNA
jgi:hypothetical protein